MIENIAGLIKQVEECIVLAYQKGYKDGISVVVNEVTGSIQKAIESEENK